jgi:hypothetical protein
MAHNPRRQKHSTSPNPASRRAFSSASSGKLRSSPVQHRRRERARATTEIQHVPVGRRERHKQLNACRDHVFVRRDETPDLDVIAFSIDIEVALD